MVGDGHLNTHTGYGIVGIADALKCQDLVIRDVSFEKGDSKTRILIGNKKIKGPKKGIKASMCLSADCRDNLLYDGLTKLLKNQDQNSESQKSEAVKRQREEEKTSQYQSYDITGNKSKRLRRKGGTYKRPS